MWDWIFQHKILEVLSVYEIYCFFPSNLVFRAQIDWTDEYSNWHYKHLIYIWWQFVCFFVYVDSFCTEAFLLTNLHSVRESSENLQNLLLHIAKICNKKSFSAKNYLIFIFSTVWFYFSINHIYFSLYIFISLSIYT